MNKILLVATVAIALFMGCSKKNDVQVNTADSLIGKWYFTTDSSKTYYNNSLINNYSQSFDHSDYIKFNSDGTGSELTESVLLSFTFSVKDNNLTITYAQQTVDGIDVSEISKAGTFKISSGKLDTYFDYFHTGNDGVTLHVIEADHFTNK